MSLRGAKPVVDDTVKKYIEKLNPCKDLYNENIQSEFIENFYNWIDSSKLNNLQGLNLFTNRKICAGTTQAFDHFYWQHKDKKIRMYSGEFMYHSAVLKHGGRIGDLSRPIHTGDAVIISVPFSDYGRQHPRLNSILDQCDEMNIPVLLDFAYYPCSKNINVDLSRECIKTITFSISKAFYGAEFLRVGMRLQKKDIDDGIDVFNSVEMVNRVSLSIANSLINKYSIDHNWNTYEDVYLEVCEENNLKPTDCIMFGLGGEEYADYNRGTEVNRVCISELIGEKINGRSK